ncbi:MAG: trypsin-like peptidase domain-containing protein [Pirellulales bacterium]|jgi:serine protease Do|nr:trypsin-like peptidase domain-containing protein [Pirellulales bacterium]
MRIALLPSLRRKTLLTLVASVVAGLSAAGRLPAEDRTPRLTPVEEAGRKGERIDPMRPVRLTAEERDRLYEQAARDAEPLERQAMQLRRLASLLRPTVVHIDATKRLLRPRGGRTTEDESGSGVIIEVDGRIVVITNRHVVHGADLDAIVIRLDDGREVRPRRAWSDAGTDIAVLELAEDDLQVARVAKDDTLQIGDTVLAIGSPFGLAHSVTLGIVSAKGRRDLEIGSGAVRFQDFIQTDAAINPGNSGGPLVNLRGEVVGLNTAIASNSGGSEGIGFAIPISMAMFVTEQLVKHGGVSRAYLGVALDRDFTPREAHRLGMVRPVGARVEAVTVGAPAAAAGVRPDDVILEFDGRAIEDDDHLMSVVGTTDVDRTVSISLFRDRERVELQIPVARRTDFE